MKSILVIDEMPNQCIECPCYRQVRGNTLLLEYCNANEKRLTWQEVVEVPEWCPLKPLPELMPYEQTDTQTVKAVKIDNGFRLGFNTCLEEIEK